jgi:glycosyltransferase involved in cell wall biosynthesis
MQPSDKAKVVVVMPAYNAPKTLRITYDAIPKDDVDHVILVDDGSRDETLQIAKELRLEVFVHARNFGRGSVLSNSDNFVFDQEMLVQSIHLGFRIKEVPVPTRYFAEASSARFKASVVYGLSPDSAVGYETFRQVIVDCGLEHRDI